MRELPILMNGAMVRAVLEGRKTVTRRMVKPQPTASIVRHACMTEGTPLMSGCFWEIGGPVIFSPWQVGDRLYVRETWALHDQGFDTTEESSFPIYQADTFRPEPKRWRPSIHMPKEHARIWLKVTAVRIERLQDITEVQAKAEGCFFTDYGRECGHTGFGWTDVGACPGHESTHPQRAGWMWDKTTSHDECLHSARFAFGNLWNSTGGAWDDNPWVWVVEFRRVDHVPEQITAEYRGSGISGVEELRHG